MAQNRLIRQMRESGSKYVSNDDMKALKKKEPDRLTTPSPLQSRLSIVLRRNNHDCAEHNLFLPIAGVERLRGVIKFQFHCNDCNIDDTIAVRFN